jgi:hypothetical protein
LAGDTLHLTLKEPFAIKYIQSTASRRVIKCTKKLHEETMSISYMEGREANFIEIISGIMNEEILGLVDNKCHGQCLLNQTKEKA